MFAAVAALASFVMALGSLIYWSNFLNSKFWMSANLNNVYNLHNYWRAWTTLFVHGDEKHLLSNLFFFFIFGSLLAAHFGLKIFPVLSFIAGGAINLISLRYMSPQVDLIGASGMVFFMGGFWLAMYFALDLKRSLRGRVLRLFGVSLMLFFPSEAFDPAISYRTHFIGFALGVTLGTLYFLKHRHKFQNAIRYEEVWD